MRLKDLVRDWGTLTIVVTFLVTQWLKIERHEGIINAYETHGTPSVVKLTATYDERFRNADERLTRLENLAAANSSGIQDIRTELRAAVEKLTAIKESLDEHKKTTNEQIRK